MKTEKNITLLKEKIEDVRICMMTTLSLNNEFSSRPMATANVDEDGNIWFFTNEYTLKTTEISKDNMVSLIYSNPSSHTYMYVNGKAELIDDERKKESYFSAIDKAWFPGGSADPNLILIKVTPVVAEYWDSTSSKMVVAINMLKAIVTGEQYDEGHHDKLKF